MLQNIKYDYKLIKSDPMLLVSIFTPFIFYFLLRFIFPFVDKLTMEYWHFSIAPFHLHTLVFFISLVPMMVGMVYGYIMLDERDAGIITALSVTPFGKSGYLKMRMTIPTLISFLVTTVLYYLIEKDGNLNLLQVILLQFVLSMNAPLMLLFLGAFASNKIEGIAVSKGFGLLLAAILIDFLAPPPYNWLGAYSPFFWIARGFFSTSLVEFLIFFFISFAFMGLLLAGLYRKFNSR